MTRSHVLFAALPFALALFSLAAPPAGAQDPSLDDGAGDWQNATEVRSLPALNGTLGSAQAVRDVLAVGKLSFPPITLTDDTGALLIDGQAPALEQTRWFPYQVLRRATAGNLGVETATRMTCKQRGLLFQVVVTNRGTAARAFELGIKLSAATSRHDRWGWGVSRDKDAAVRFSAAAMAQGRALLLRDAADHRANCFGFERKPDELALPTNSGHALWHITLKPQASLTVNYALAVGDQDDAVQASAAQWVAHFDAAFAQVQTHWQKRWDAMFTPGNPYFSGSLPALVTPDPQMRRVCCLSAFVPRELLTQHWMRAQSLRDPAAAKLDRPDHGPMGAFCAWPGETLATFCEFGQFDQALDFLHRCAAVTREEPFGQSRELLGKTSNGPVRIAERGAKGRPTQTYNASNGGSFAETIIRGFFGYQSDLLGQTLVPDPRPRDFQGQLLNVWHHGRLSNLGSTALGIQSAPEELHSASTARSSQAKSRAELLVAAGLPKPAPLPVPGAVVALPNDWDRTNPGPEHPAWS